MAQQVRVAPKANAPGGVVFIPITDDDRLRIIRELKFSDGWKELFRMREDDRTWEEIRDRAIRLNPSLSDEDLRRGLACVYTALETALANCANARARLLV